MSFISLNLRCHDTYWQRKHTHILCVSVPLVIRSNSLSRTKSLIVQMVTQLVIR